MTTPRRRELKTISISGREFEVEIVEFPFRENVEVSTVLDGELIRISDIQLGEHEALRLLEQELRKRIS